MKQCSEGYIDAESCQSLEVNSKQMSNIPRECLQTSEHAPDVIFGLCGNLILKFHLLPLRHVQWLDYVYSQSLTDLYLNLCPRHHEKKDANEHTTQFTTHTT